MFWLKQKNEFWRDVTGLGSTGIYLLLIILFFVVEQNTVAQQLILGYVLTYCISAVIKLTFFKNRPKKEAYNNNLEKIDASAFPSVHTARAAFITLALSKIFPRAQTFFIIVTLLIGYSRIKVHKHDWTDIVGGIALGAVSFWIVTKLL